VRPPGVLAFQTQKLSTHVQYEMADRTTPAMAGFAAAAPMRVGANSGGSSSSSPPPPLRVRTNFPETWIFEDVTSSDGQITLIKSVPDTITSWFVSAFQVDPRSGLRLGTSPGKLTVFRPFFLVLDLPYSVIKGEVLMLQVLVHN
jgi:CD109 antigen